MYFHVKHSFINKLQKSKQYRNLHFRHNGDRYRSANPYQVSRTQKQIAYSDIFRTFVC